MITVSQNILAKQLLRIFIHYRKKIEKIKYVVKNDKYKKKYSIWQDTRKTNQPYFQCGPLRET